MEGKTLWENLKKGLEQGIKTITEKTEELTELGRLKLEILSVKREIEKDFVELGGRTYQLMKENKSDNINQNSDISKLVEKVKTEEKKLDEYNLKYEKLKKDMGPQDETKEPGNTTKP
jgi:hypothetical protein